MEIKIEMDNSKVLQHLTALKGAHRAAKVSALNRIAKSAKTAASKDIRERINIKKKDLDKHIKIKEAEYDKPITSLVTISKSKGTALFKFGGKKGTKRRGASFMMKKGKRIYVKGGFVVQITGEKKKGGTYTHTNIFVRSGKKSLPIDQKYGPSAAKLMRSRRVKAAIDKHIAKNWKKVYESVMKFYLRKR